MGTKGKRRGRPKGKPLSERELAQRRAAAYKHGLRSQQPLASAVPPCKRSTCRLEYPCDAKRQADADGRALARCPLALIVDDKTRAAVLDRLKGGDGEALLDQTAQRFAAMFQLHDDTLAGLQERGLAVDVPVFGRDAEGESVQIGVVPRVNPAADPFLKLGRALGVDADAQRLTPKSRGEGQALETMTSHLSTLADVRSRLPKADDD